MNTHPAKIEFQFTKREVNEADFQRFNMVFSHLGLPLPEERKHILRDLCGCLTISFEKELYLESESPLKHSNFHPFAKTFFDNCLGLPYLINLEDATFWVLFLGSLQTLTGVEVNGIQHGRWHFNKAEFCDRAELCKARVSVWCEKAGYLPPAIADRRAEIEAYLIDLQTAHVLQW